MTTIFKCTECGMCLDLSDDRDTFQCPFCGHEEDCHSEYIRNITDNFEPVCPRCKSHSIEPNFTSRDADWFCNACRIWFKEPPLDYKQVVAVDVEVKL